VITNLVTAFPGGGHAVQWLWGGFSVASPTLNRIFSLHYILSFVTFGFLFVHAALLHSVGSSCATINSSDGEYVTFYPYFVVKDLHVVFFVFLFFIPAVFCFPDVLGSSSNYQKAEALITPDRIVPEWYFLPFYAMLRAFPNKLGGVCLAAASLLTLSGITAIRIEFFGNGTRPFSSTVKSAAEFRGVYFFSTCVFMGTFFVLGWLGTKPVEEVHVFLGQLSTVYYFFFAIVVCSAQAVDVRVLERELRSASP
jgi:quinol-cytochrome oxidoreductase complex cytochrome b subunit